MKIVLKSKNQLLLEDGKIIYLTNDMITRFKLRENTSLSEEEFRDLILMRIRISAFNMLAKKRLLFT